MKIVTHKCSAAARRTYRRIALVSVAALAIPFACIAYSTVASVVAVAAEKLSVGQARRAIARTAGIKLPTDAIEVEKEGISVLGSTATVEAKVKTAFRLRRAKGEEWEVAEVRLGENRWEDVALLSRALDEEKAERARAELAMVQTALEAFRRERGHYPPGADARTLADHLSPRYLERIIRIDPWQQPYEYTGTLTSYRLLSAGADRKLGTADDIASAMGG